MWWYRGRLVVGEGDLIGGGPAISLGRHLEAVNQQPLMRDGRRMSRFAAISMVNVILPFCRLQRLCKKR